MTLTGDMNGICSSLRVAGAAVICQPFGFQTPSHLPAVSSSVKNETKDLQFPVPESQGTGTQPNDRTGIRAETAELEAHTVPVWCLESRSRLTEVWRVLPTPLINLLA